ncbi:MAG: putative DNA-binding domain-containing protein [Bacteriovoracaceae bacterium]
MKEWFDKFEETLRDGNPSSDLIGAGTSGAEKAMAHYRYQHRAKLREAVEDTFPVLVKRMGNEWNEVWNAFISQNKISPRSLDWFPEVFLNYFIKTDAPLWQKELARFEHRMDIHPWSNRPLSPRLELEMDEDSCVHLGNHEIVRFKVGVTEIYRDGEVKGGSESVLLWQKQDGVYFRAMKEWELNVLTKLSLGVGVALEEAPEDPEAVGEFFQWLGGSHLIQKITQG